MRAAPGMPVPARARTTGHERARAQRSTGTSGHGPELALSGRQRAYYLISPVPGRARPVPARARPM